eukprot:scaffold13712_cov121-Skeletonema_dohrnii-CCMP3373.AAC.1
MATSNNNSANHNIHTRMEDKISDRSTEQLGRQRILRRRRIRRLAVALITFAAAFRNITQLEIDPPTRRTWEATIHNSSCQTEPGSELIFTTNASVFPHSPEFTSISWHRFKALKAFVSLPDCSLAISS